MVGMTNTTEAELVLLGYRVVLFGDLADMRKKTGLSRNAQANLIGVDGESLRKWEDLDRAMNIETALRVGEWYWGAESAMNGIDFTNLVPISKAAQYMGMSQSSIQEMADKDEIKHESLGVLGLFVDRCEMSIPVGV